MALAILDRMRNARAVYWPPGPVDASGQATFGQPIELAVYWLDDLAIILSAGGEQIASKAQVWTDPDEPSLVEGGFLKKGTLASVPTNLRNVPKRVPGSYQIRGIKEAANVRGTRTERKVYL